jgi:hypothetical protein
MTAPTTSALPKIPLDPRALSRHDKATQCLADQRLVAAASCRSSAARMAARSAASLAALMVDAIDVARTAQRDRLGTVSSE